ncbi:MAG: hypothetical protein JWN73_3797 [Betaproteobacteria bacterium]|nr:hypothetical protein [Betaproteobacteria bacterium]
MKLFARHLLAPAALALASSAALAQDSGQYWAEVAVADGNYQAALQECNVLYGEQRMQCMNNARIARVNAVDNARARATTVVIIHPQPMPGTTPADRADAMVSAQQDVYGKP